MCYCLLRGLDTSHVTLNELLSAGALCLPALRVQSLMYEINKRSCFRGQKTPV